MFGTVLEYFQFLIARNTAPAMVDKLFCCAETDSNVDMAVIMFNVNSTQHMKYMCREADNILMIPDTSKLYIGAMYVDISRYPVARYYFVNPTSHREAALLAVQLQADGLSVEIPSPEAFSKIVREEGWQARIAEFKANRAARKADISGLHEGRRNNTTIQDLLLINSNGCIICNQAATHVASMTIADGRGESGSMFSVRLCEEHLLESRSMLPLSNYLAKKFSVPIFIDTQIREPQEVLDDAENIISTKLDMHIERRTHKDIHANSKCGTKFIYRYCDKSYGYMINALDGTKLMRIDSANHHPVEFGPDHIHPDPQKMLPPQSSFTTGDICIDWPLIKKLLDARRSQS